MESQVTQSLDWPSRNEIRDKHTILQGPPWHGSGFPEKGEQLSKVMLECVLKSDFVRINSVRMKSALKNSENSYRLSPPLVPDVSWEQFIFRRIKKRENWG